MSHAEQQQPSPQVRSMADGVAASTTGFDPAGLGSIPSPPTEVIHIVSPEGEGDWTSSVTFVEALCGAGASIFENGEVQPPEFDFVLSPDPLSQSDCMPCIEKAALQLLEKTRVQHA